MSINASPHHTIIEAPSLGELDVDVLDHAVLDEKPDLMGRLLVRAVRERGLLSDEGLDEVVIDDDLHVDRIAVSEGEGTLRHAGAVRPPGD